MFGFNYMYDDDDCFCSRQLPTASTSPVSPSMQSNKKAQPYNPAAAGAGFNPSPAGFNPTPSGITPTPAGLNATPAAAPSTVAGVQAASTVPVLSNIGFTQAFLKTQIGKQIRVDFLIGTNTLLDRGGVLEEVGISYIVLRDQETQNRVMADLYAIKFVTIFE